MKRVKQAFDPLGILNPGKIFPATVVAARAGTGIVSRRLFRRASGSWPRRSQSCAGSRRQGMRVRGPRCGWRSTPTPES